MDPGCRRLLGIAGPPGAGKSTLAAALAARLPSERVAVLPQDGFHLADSVLAVLGLSHRKGAPETFDVQGFRCLLDRVRHDRKSVIYAPEFRRELEAAIAGSIRIHPGTLLVIVEGNYLLLNTGPWSQIRDMLDESWYLQLPDPTRVSRLIHRHRDHGRSLEEAQAWALGNDERNAAIIRQSISRADVIIRTPTS